MESGTKNGVWHPKWSLAPKMESGTENGVWHPKWSLAPKMESGTENGVWHRKWSLAPKMTKMESGTQNENGNCIYTNYDFDKLNLYCNFYVTCYSTNSNFYYPRILSIRGFFLPYNHVSYMYVHIRKGARGVYFRLFFVRNLANLP